jgi:hypothetical protein
VTHLDAVRASLAGAVERLERAGVADEALAVFVRRKRLLGMERAPVMQPVGRVWPIGVLLLASDGGLHATGKITRAVPAGYPGYQSPGLEVRRGYRAAAHAGKFVEGDTVNFDTVDLDENGRARVRWNPANPGQSRDLDAYLADRVGLLVER